MPQAIQLSRRSMLILPLGLAACGNGSNVVKLTGATMGTSFNLVAVDAPSYVTQEDVSSAVHAALDEVTAQMSNWDATSEISRFNAAASTDETPVSPELAYLMAAAQDVHDASLGRFDTTIGPLIEAWGFGADGSTPHNPSHDTVHLAAARSGHDNTLRIAPGVLQKRQSDTQVYLAAIGKGYGADRVGRALGDLGITNYMIEIGGDLYAAGRNEDGLPWQIGVETPEAWTRGVMEVVGLTNMGLASSGDYRNYFEEDGKRYSHVIDPVTGAPITHRTASATVMAENGMLADAWATAMLTLGRDAGLEVAEAHDVAVLFIDRDGDGFSTTASARFAALQA